MRGQQKKGCESYGCVLDREIASPKKKRKSLMFPIRVLPLCWGSGCRLDSSIPTYLLQALVRDPPRYFLSSTHYFTYDCPQEKFDRFWRTYNTVCIWEGGNEMELALVGSKDREVGGGADIGSHGGAIGCGLPGMHDDMWRMRMMILFQCFTK